MTSSKEILRGHEVSSDGKSSADRSHLNVKAVHESGDVRNALSQIDKADTSDTTVDNADGRVSERTSKRKDGDFKSTGSTKTQSLDPALVRRQRLIASKPSASKMINEIRHHYKAETKQVLKDIKVAQRKNDWYTYTSSMARLRQISSFLSHLAHESYESLKSLWLKLVHDIV